MRLNVIIVLLVILVFPLSQAMADDNLFDQFQDYAADEIDAYATPVVEAFGIGVGSGLYHTARTHGTLGFDVGLRAMMVLIPQGKSAILDSADVKLVPLPVIQASVGLPMDFEVMARGFSFSFQDKTVSLYGAAVKKSLSSLIPIPGFPDVSAMIAYHSFKGGDVLTASVLSFDAMVSKTFLVISPYAGFGLDRTSMKVEYAYQPPSVPPLPPPPEVPVSHTIKVSTGRFTVGLNLTPVPFVKIFADYTFAKFSEATAGLAISIR